MADQEKLHGKTHEQEAGVESMLDHSGFTSDWTPISPPPEDPLQMSSPSGTNLLQLTDLGENSPIAPLQLQETAGGAVATSLRPQPRPESAAQTAPETSLIPRSRPEHPETLGAPLIPPELAQLRHWRTENVVNGRELNGDEYGNLTIISQELFILRYMTRRCNEGQQQGEAETLEASCPSREEILQSPELAILRGHLSELGPFVNWAAVPRATRQIEVMRELIDDFNFPVLAAAGVVGNLDKESAVQPNRVEGSRETTPMRSRGNRDGESGTYDWTTEEISERVRGETGPRLGGVGLAQWTYAARREDLFEHEFEGETLGADILFNMDAQISFIVAELQTGEFRGVYEVLMNEGVSLNQASDEFCYTFEKPGSTYLSDGRTRRPRTDPEVVAEFTDRRNRGQQALNAYNNWLDPEQQGP